MREEFIIITNNPLVVKELGEEHRIEYAEVSFEEILGIARDLVHKGCRILTHPLSGSVKPKETPYKTIMMSPPKPQGEPVDIDSLKLIEKAIETCEKFQDKSGMYGSRTLEDFQMIDLMLIRSAMT